MIAIMVCFFENKVKTRLAIIKMETLPKPSVLIVWYYTAPFLFRFGFAFLPKDRSHLKDGAVLKIRCGKKGRGGLCDFEAYTQVGFISVRVTSISIKYYIIDE